MLMSSALNCSVLNDVNSLSHDIHMVNASQNTVPHNASSLAHQQSTGSRPVNSVVILGVLQRTIMRGAWQLVF